MPPLFFVATVILFLRQIDRITAIAAATVKRPGREDKTPWTAVNHFHPDKPAGIARRDLSRSAAAPAEDTEEEAMKTLFDKTRINKMELRNRIIRSATWENMADENGGLPERLLKVYEDLAKGGVGLILTGTAYVAEGPTAQTGHMRIGSETLVREYGKLTHLVHRHGSSIMLQINHAGESEETSKPADLTRDDIESIIPAFGNTAARAEQAGFDGVQIHAAHGFFLSRFLNCSSNRRQDEYGGNLENNARIILRVYEEIRKKTAPDFSVFVKVNCIGPVNCGKTFEACKYLCTRLSDMGIDGIEISGNILSSGDGISPYAESIYRDYAAIIADEVKAPVILTGLNRTVAVMTEILNKTKISYFALSRPLIRQPDLVNIWQEDEDRAPECISCDKCFREDGNTCIFN